MIKIKNIVNEIGFNKQHLKLCLLIIPSSIVIGLMVALFLWLLDLATITRNNNIWIIAFLPLAGVFIHWLYYQYGKNSSAGNNLIIDEIHQPQNNVPLRMTPLVLFTTIVTHLFGGSAGREGTAVQMGGSLSAFWSKYLKLEHEQKRFLLMAGIAAGFGAVFGTPLAGAIFALEVIVVGKIKYEGVLLCLLASFMAHITCLFVGIEHTSYAINYHSNTASFLNFQVDFVLLLKVLLAGIAFGLTARLFSWLSHFMKEKLISKIRYTYLTPILGGLTVLLISVLLGTFDYIGLGVESNQLNGVSIVNAFSLDTIPKLGWFWKLLLTIITLSTGFKGGEVTPLFFIGATLGNAIAVSFNLPIDLFAGLGFIAVFAGAANTPLACVVMGIELFGLEHVLYFLAACFAAYFVSGNKGIYQAQRVTHSKWF